MLWYCSTQKQQWQKMCAGSAPETSNELTLLDARQTIRGFGGCFNELGYDSIGALDEQKREKVMRALFAPEECGFGFCRLPMGANDFSMDWYSLDETPGDWEMKHFSIDRDRERLIPFIRQARQWSPDLELFASPWSPPTWMKTPAVYNYGRLNPDEKTLHAYALYFLKFVEAYRAEGIEIQRLCPQNEVFADQKFPSCLWTGELMRDFIGQHLGPVLKQFSPRTEIWLGTINGPYNDYFYGDWHRQNYNAFASVVLEDAQARQYIQGAALQWGGKHILQQLRLSHPELSIIQSECECGDGRNRPEDVAYMFDLLWQYMQMGAEAFVYWNLSLDETAQSTWGWKQNSLVTVNRQERSWHLNPEYYFMKHVSAFLCKGAVRYATSGAWTANTLCFRRPDGAYVYLVHNPFEQLRTIRLSCPVASASFELPGRSLSTIVLDGKA